MSRMTTLDDLAAVALCGTEKLARGRQLSKALLKDWNVSSGSVWSTVHAAVGPHDGLDFVQGGKLADVRERGLEEPEPLLAEFIQERLLSDDSALIVENELKTRGDGTTECLPGTKAYAVTSSTAFFRLPTPLGRRSATCC